LRGGREERGMTAAKSFGSRAQLKAAGRTFEIFRLDALERRGLAVSRLPYSLRILLENLLRREDGRTVAAPEIEKLARWDPKQAPDDEIAFMPARVLMQDFTGVPAVVDLAARPDTLVGTDSHTTMINGLGVLGWGVGGIEAEAAMLGQPVSMLIPQVVGFRLTGRLAEGATATDLVLTVTELLRKKGVVGKFVEFYGPGMAALPVADRAT